MNALTPINNTEIYRASTDAASLCRNIVVETAMEIQGRKYVKVEGWMAIALAHGCTASARDVERIEGGVRAIGEIRRMSDGVVIAEAEGFVGEDEPTWFGGTVTAYGKTKTLPKRADYAIRAMTQTRAISRACRSAFAHVVVMMNAGLSTTPAEEVPDGGFDNEPRNVTPPKGEPQGAAVHSGRAINTPLETFIAAMKMNKTVETVDAWSAREANNIVEKLKGRDQDDMQAAYDAYRASLMPKDDAPKTATKTLADRAAILESALSACTDINALRRTYEQGARLCADLDAADPELLAEITGLYERLYGGLPAEAPNAKAPARVDDRVDA